MVEYQQFNPFELSGGTFIDLSPVFAFPPTLSIDTIEVHAQTVIIHLHGTSPTAACPSCGTVGSRVHSRYERTIADVTFGRRGLVLKLLVRKWICPEVSCPQHIFAERFSGLVQRYARMTDRLIEALQSVGVTTNGADAARILSSLGMPTTAKTVIRRVLQLPLPEDGPVCSIGIDEWAWKKGSHYGTILVDLERQRVAALLPDRSEEQVSIWLAKHPEIKWISRDRGKIFRDAATRGAPQAQHVADRFHLQQNLAQALKRFFQRNAHVLKTTTRLSGETLPVPTSPGAQRIEQASQHSHANRIMCPQRIWELFRAGHRKEEIARLTGISSRSVYRALAQEQPPPRLRRYHSHHLVDPYLSYVAQRWNEGCQKPSQLYAEVVAQGYTGSKRTLERVLQQFSTQEAGKPITRQTVTMAKAFSARSAALTCVRAPQDQTKDQKAFIHQVCQVDPTVAAVYTLAQDFGHLLRKREGVQRLEHWKASVRASEVKELISFVDGLTDDTVAIANACTQPWSNGMVEGYHHKLKLIKRSSYGQAGFPLLQRRVLLHPAQTALMQQSHSPKADGDSVDSEVP